MGGRVSRLKRVPRGGGGVESVLVCTTACRRMLIILQYRDTLFLIDLACAPKVDNAKGFKEFKGPE